MTPRHKWIPLACTMATIVGVSGKVYAADPLLNADSDCTTINITATDYPADTQIQVYLNGVLNDSATFENSYSHTMQWVGDERDREHRESYRVVLDATDDTLDQDLTLTRLPTCSAIVQARMHKPPPPGGRVRRESSWVTTTTVATPVAPAIVEEEILENHTTTTSTTQRPYHTTTTVPVTTTPRSTTSTVSSSTTSPTQVTTSSTSTTSQPPSTTTPQSTSSSTSSTTSAPTSTSSQSSVTPSTQPRPAPTTTQPRPSESLPVTATKGTRDKLALATLVATGGWFLIRITRRKV